MVGGTKRALVLAGLFSALFGVASPASARKTYPGVVQEQFGGGCAPECTLCHTRIEGGTDSDPYLKPNELDPGYVAPVLPPNRGRGEFLANLIHVNGHQTPHSDAALRNALHLLATANCNTDATAPCDSDGDTVQDTTELGMDRNPDVPNDKEGDLCVGPKYGCGAHLGAEPRGLSAERTGAVVLSLFGLGLVVLRRVRRG